jgi:hypothetical protein
MPRVEVEGEVRGEVVVEEEVQEGEAVAQCPWSSLRKALACK